MISSEVACWLRRMRSRGEGTLAMPRCQWGSFGGSEDSKEGIPVGIRVQYREKLHLTINCTAGRLILLLWRGDWWASIPIDLKVVPIRTTLFWDLHLKNMKNHHFPPFFLTPEAHESCGLSFWSSWTQRKWAASDRLRISLSACGTFLGRRQEKDRCKRSN